MCNIKGKLWTLGGNTFKYFNMCDELIDIGMSSKVAATALRGKSLTNVLLKFMHWWMWTWVCYLKGKLRPLGYNTLQIFYVLCNDGCGCVIP